MAACTRLHRVIVDQKEPELLEKVIRLMESNAKIYSRPNGKSRLHTIKIDNKKIYKDVCRLGITPRKSHTLVFPEMPPAMVRHFIRGCWDGDGSIYWSGGKWVATLTSASVVFLEHVTTHLAAAGIVRRVVLPKGRVRLGVPLTIHAKRHEGRIVVRTC
jgi:hypothetical protein